MNRPLFITAVRGAVEYDTVWLRKHEQNSLLWHVRNFLLHFYEFPKLKSVNALVPYSAKDVEDVSYKHAFQPNGFFDKTQVLMLLNEGVRGRDEHFRDEYKWIFNNFSFSNSGTVIPYVIKCDENFRAEKNLPLVKYVPFYIDGIEKPEDMPGGSWLKVIYTDKDNNKQFLRLNRTWMADINIFYKYGFKSYTSTYTPITLELVR